MGSTMRRDQCCLCGKVKEQVPKLIVGLHGAVCSSCIDLCGDILADNPHRTPDFREVEDGGYTLRISPQLAKAFPDPRQISWILEQFGIIVERAAADAVEVRGSAEKDE